jgi:hypothetical protein
MPERVKMVSKSLGGHGHRFEWPCFARHAHRSRWAWHPKIEMVSMRKHIGFTLQFLVLFVFLPMIVLWQLAFSFRLILMPALLIVGILLFWIGHKLREG